MSKASDAFKAPVSGIVLKKSADHDNFHGTIVPDPFRWMENVSDPDVKEWASAQNDRASAFIDGSPVFENLRQEIEFALKHQEEGLVEKKGGRYFLTYNDGTMQQPALAVRQTPLGETKIILDPNKWSEKGTSSLQSYSINEDGSLLAFARSDGGMDVSSVQIMDLKTGKFLKDKIDKTRFPSFVWKSAEGFYYQIPTADESKRKMVKYHAIGTDATHDIDIFCHEQSGTAATPYKVADSNNLWIRLAAGTNKNVGLWRVDFNHPENKQEIFPKEKAHIEVIGEIGSKIFIETSYKADRKRILKFDIHNPAIENWVEVLPEHECDVIAKSFIHKGRLYISYLSDCTNRLEVFALDGKKIRDIKIQERSIVEFGSVSEKSDDIYFKVIGYLAAPTDYRLDTKTEEVHTHRISSCPINLEGCIVERLFATSKDGTKVPMTVVRRADVPLDGSAATCLYGYGGFNIPILPSFAYSKWAWVDRGGIFVETNLRGGGEFGSNWCEQGKLHNKQNVFDDFIACGEELIQRGYTSSERLMSYGGSNGGLLTLATMIQRPDLFQSVVSGVPVTDMLRFMVPTFGALWVSDYGKPHESAEDFAVSMKYSPLHNVKPGAVYPPCMMMTAHGDDRVVPWHAYKMTATLNDQCPDSRVFLQVSMDTGHGAGKSKKQIAEAAARLVAWGERTLGPFEPQKGLNFKKGIDIKSEPT